MLNAAWKVSFRLGGICPLNRGILYGLDFLSSEELHNSDETSHYDATPNADCTLVAEPELAPAPLNQVSYSHQETDPLAIFTASDCTTAFPDTPTRTKKKHQNNPIRMS